MIPNLKSWPPFPIQKLPSEVHDWMQEYSRAITHQHPPSTNSLLSIVIPCYNPRLNQLEQLLFSLQLQTDQCFDVVLVNDGSSSTIWKDILKLLKPFPWIKVISHSFNQGISATLNTAIANTSTTYAALVDQDDIIHPNTISLVKEALLGNPQCNFLYSDHIVFDDSGLSCSYIPKFPWNPIALLEYNYLIHLTVIKCSFYMKHGGMSSQYDGIQDWEFYLRIAAFLTDHSVEYLPIPLYAWRLSPTSTASSATPKKELINKAFSFVQRAHQSLDSGVSPLFPTTTHNHYRFSNTYHVNLIAICPCSILLFYDKSSMADVDITLDSLDRCGITYDQILLIQADDDSSSNPQIFEVFQSSAGSGKRISICKLEDIPKHINPSQPLLSLRAGISIDKSSSFCDLPQWLERTSRWDMITIPTFSSFDGRCISAGYANGVLDDIIYLPYAQGISRSAYQADFSTFNNTRIVNIPSPTIQLIRSSCLPAIISRCSSKAKTARCSPADFWWNLLASSDLRCCCLGEISASLSPRLCAVEYNKFATLQDSFLRIISADDWQYLFGDYIKKPYLSILYHIFLKKPGRVHPLYYYTWLNRLFQATLPPTPSSDISNTQFLDQGVVRPLVILIPTEVNARSHGHACLLSLALQLSNAGISVYLLPFNPYSFFKNYFYHLPAKYRELQFIVHPSDVRDAALLLPESTPPKIVNQLRRYYSHIIWWLLAPAGLLTSYMSSIKQGDFLIPFSEFAFPGQSQYLFVHPEEDRSLSKQVEIYRPVVSSRMTIAIYTGKGRIRPLPPCLHRHLLVYNIIPVTRTSPPSKEELYRLMSDCRGMISFDPLTNLSLEAARLGLPTFLVNNPFPNRCFTEFPNDLSVFITSDSSEFICRIQGYESKKNLSVKPLLRASEQAKTHMLRLIQYPFGSPELQVNEQKLTTIQRYLYSLKSTRSIQVVNDGQAASSIFFDVYLDSLKAPYSTHLRICTLLKWLDDVVDLIDKINLYPLVRLLFRCLPRFQRLLRSRYNGLLMWLLAR